MCGDDYVLDTNVLNEEHMQVVTRLLNEAYQAGFHKCSVELMNKENDE